MVDFNTAQQQLNQRAQQIQQAQQQISEFDPRIQQTQQQLRAATQNSQVRVQSLEQQRAEAKQSAMGEVSAAQREQAQLEAEFNAAKAAYDAEAARISQLQEDYATAKSLAARGRGTFGGSKQVREMYEQIRSGQQGQQQLQEVTRQVQELAPKLGVKFDQLNVPKTIAEINARNSSLSQQPTITFAKNIDFGIPNGPSEFPLENLFSKSSPQLRSGVPSLPSFSLGQQLGQNFKNNIEFLGKNTLSALGAGGEAISTGLSGFTDLMKFEARQPTLLESGGYALRRAGYERAGNFLQALQRDNAQTREIKATALGKAIETSPYLFAETRIPTLISQASQAVSSGNALQGAPPGAFVIGETVSNLGGPLGRVLGPLVESGAATALAIQAKKQEDALVTQRDQLLSLQRQNKLNEASVNTYLKTETNPANIKSLVEYRTALQNQNKELATGLSSIDAGLKEASTGKILGTIGSIVGAAATGRGLGTTQFSAISRTGTGLSDIEFAKLRDPSTPQPEYSALRIKAINNLDKGSGMLFAKEEITSFNDKFPPIRAQDTVDYLNLKQGERNIAQQALDLRSVGTTEPFGGIGIETPTKPTDSEINIFARDLNRLGLFKLDDAVKGLQEANKSLRNIKIGPLKDVSINKGSLFDISKKEILPSIVQSPSLAKSITPAEGAEVSIPRIGEYEVNQGSVGFTQTFGKNKVGVHIDYTIDARGRPTGKRFTIIQQTKKSPFADVKIYDEARTITREFPVAGQPSVIVTRTPRLRLVDRLIVRSKALNLKEIGKTDWGTAFSQTSKFEARRVPFGFNQKYLSAQGVQKEVESRPLSAKQLARLYKQSKPLQRGISETGSAPFGKVISQSLETSKGPQEIKVIGPRIGTYKVTRGLSTTLQRSPREIKLSLEETRPTKGSRTLPSEVNFPEVKSASGAPITFPERPGISEQSRISELPTMVGGGGQGIPPGFPQGVSPEMANYLASEAQVPPFLGEIRNRIPQVRVPNVRTNALIGPSAFQPSELEGLGRRGLSATGARLKIEQVGKEVLNPKVKNLLEEGNVLSPGHISRIRGGLGIVQQPAQAQVVTPIQAQSQITIQQTQQTPFVELAPPTVTTNFIPPTPPTRTRTKIPFPRGAVPFTRPVKQPVRKQVRVVTEVRRRGKFLPVSQPIAPDEALRIGVAQTRGGIARTFRLRPVGGATASEVKLSRLPNTEIFRAPRGRAAQPLTFVEKNPYALKGSPGAVRDIIASRRGKALPFFRRAK